MQVFEWSYYRSDLLVTHSANSRIVNFWDLKQHEFKMKEESHVLDRPIHHMLVKSDEIKAVAWKRFKNTNPILNKFLVLTKKGIIEE